MGLKGKGKKDKEEEKLLEEKEPEEETPAQGEDEEGGEDAGSADSGSDEESGDDEDGEGKESKGAAEEEGLFSLSRMKNALGMEDGEEDSEEAVAARAEKEKKKKRKKAVAKQERLEFKGTRTFKVAIHVLEARNLQPRDAGGKADPVCFIEVGKEKKHTKTFKKTLNCVWDQQFFFEPKLDQKGFDMGKVILRVYDADTFGRKEEIGSYELGFNYIYGQEQHDLFKKWIALTDTSGEHAGVQGFVKVSVAVLGPGDPEPSHSEEEEEDDDEGKDLNDLVLMPPDIEVQGYYLNLRIYKAEDLPKLDMFGKSDPYVKIQFAGLKPAKTQVQKKTLNPVWNEEIKLPVFTPTMSDTINVQVFDWDPAGTHDMIAQNVFYFSKILDEPFGPAWVNLYGPPLKGGLGAEKGKGADTVYKGRVLMGIEVEESDSPVLEQMEVYPCEPPPVDSYTLRCDLLEVHDMPHDGHVKLEVSVGPHRLRSKAVRTSKGGARIYEQFEDLRVSLPQDVDTIPDVFVDVYYVKVATKKRVGFLRYKPRDVLGFDRPIMWEPLLPDTDSSMYSVDLAPGFVLLRVEFGRSDDAPRDRIPLEPPDMRQYEMRAFIYQARHLIGSDASGASDPYVVVQCGSKRSQTSKKKSTRNPLWYEPLVFPVLLPEPIELAPDVHVRVYDHDRFSRNDVLGRFDVPIMDLDARWPGDPKWYPLYLNDPTDTSYGAVLASFQLIPQEKAEQVPIPDIMPKFRNCTLEASLIGLRNLPPYAMMDIQEPFVEFDVGDGSDKAKPARSKATGKPRGDNPNHLETIRMPIRMPLNPLYSSAVNVRVFDTRMKGAYTPLIGTTAIDLAQFMDYAGAEGVEAADGFGMDGAPALPPPEEFSAGAGDEDDEDEESDSDGEDRPLVDKKAKKSAKGAKKSGGADDEDDMKTLPREGKDRMQLPRELESYLDDLPYQEYPLQRGEDKRGEEGAEEQVAGTMKASFRIFAPDEDPGDSAEFMMKYRPKRVSCRVYMLRAFGLTPKDAGGGADPYVVIKYGPGKKDQINDVRHVIKEDLNPEFYQVYEFSMTIPGQSALTIQIWDWDQIGGDDLIGETVIDLEKRWFSPRWNSIRQKPIETRSLWHPTSTSSQGKVEMWLEIMEPGEARKIPRTVIGPPPPTPYELRVIVWGTDEVPLDDKKTRGLYVEAAMQGDKKPQRTDIHWQCRTGKASFNWRMKFPVDLPMKTPRFTMTLYDRDLAMLKQGTSVDMVGTAVMDLGSIFKKALRKGTSIELEQKMLEMTHPSMEGSRGKIVVSLEILPESEARNKPNGLGRKDPNQHPELPEPEGREGFNPLRVDKWIGKGIGAVLGKLKQLLITILILGVVGITVYIILWKKCIAPAPPGFPPQKC